jgi:hypothetical protein
MRKLFWKAKQMIKLNNDIHIIAKWKTGSYCVEIRDSVEKKIKAYLVSISGEQRAVSLTTDIEENFKCILRKQLSGSTHLLETHFYPIIHRFSDGTFSVSFHTRGLGGGGVCCKEEDSDAKRPLLLQQGAVAALEPAVLIPLPSVEPDLIHQKIQTMREGSLKAFSEFTDTYIPLTDFEQNTMQFLSSKQRVLLLKGEAGSGKSLFLEYITSRLWQNYKPQNTIPLFISLPLLKNPTRKCVEETLERAGFTPDEIIYLKATQSFVFLLDAYDELSTRENLLISNRLGEWKSKIIISCHSHRLSGDYRSLFIPSINHSPSSNVIREETISPFSSSQRNSYLKKKIAKKNTPWKDWRDCRAYINKIPGLISLVQNPFILSMVVQLLPEHLERYLNGQREKNMPLTRSEIYHLFLEQWFEQEARLKSGPSGMGLGEQQKRIGGEDLREEFRVFSIRLARKMYDKEVYSISYDEGVIDIPSEWDSFFSSLNPRVALIRSGCPLKKVGNYWSFIHSTILEFFISAALFELRQNVSASQDEEREDFVSQIINNLDCRQCRIFENTSVIKFCADWVRVEPRLRESLLEIISLSATNHQADLASPNALVILHAAGVINENSFLGASIPQNSLSAASGKEFSSLSTINYVQPKNGGRAGAHRCVIFKSGRKGMAVLLPDKREIIIRSGTIDHEEIG